MVTPRTSRTQEISDALRDEILAGQYRPGERLPSERDLAARFDTSRGTVREAFKKLEQLGVASIQPGGARVVPLQDCTLDVLGPLLDLGDMPDPRLVEQALDVGIVLVRFAVERAMERNGERTVAEARAITREMLEAEVERIQDVLGPPRLIRLFSSSADHLVLKLIMNGLRGQVVERMHAVGFPPRHDPRALRKLALKLDRALADRDTARTADAMTELLELVRSGVKRKLGRLDPELRVASR